jgi:hypothetical protein
MLKAVLYNKKLQAEIPFDKVLDEFFANNTPESAYSILFKFFQCWVVNDCKIKAALPDEDIALFLDQLNALVAAAYILHQGNRVHETMQKGVGDD